MSPLNIQMKTTRFFFHLQPPKCSSVSHSVVSDSLRSHGLGLTRLFCPWVSPGKNTGAGCHFLLQEIFLTQGSNLGFLHCRQTLYRLSHQGSQHCWLSWSDIPARSITYKIRYRLFCTMWLLTIWLFITTGISSVLSQFIKHFHMP